MTLLRQLNLFIPPSYLSLLSRDPAPEKNSWQKFYGSGKWATDDLTFVFKFKRPRASTTSFIATITFDSTHFTTIISVPRCRNLLSDKAKNFSVSFSFVCRGGFCRAYLLYCNLQSPFLDFEKRVSASELCESFSIAEISLRFRRYRFA